MLEAELKRIVAAHPDYAAITPVIEKEILHHDIINVLVQQGVMRRLTFIGGTSLRLCYDSARLSEDLDFNAGFDFKPSQFAGLEDEIKAYLERKYATQVQVSKPLDDKQGNTSSWRISLVKVPERPDIPKQRLHIDVCALPSFATIKKPLINHYGIVVPTEGLLLPVQTLDEILVDKVIAFAYRARRIKPRDLWDIGWLKQHGARLDIDLLKKKLSARRKSSVNFKQALDRQQAILLQAETRDDFVSEMSRFIPQHIKARTLDNADYWSYLQEEVANICRDALQDDDSSRPFDMG